MDAGADLDRPGEPGRREGGVPVVVLRRGDRTGPASPGSGRPPAFSGGEIAGAAPAGATAAPDRPRPRPRERRRSSTRRREPGVTGSPPASWTTRSRPRREARKTTHRGSVGDQRVVVAEQHQAAQVDRLGPDSERDTVHGHDRGHVPHHVRASADRHAVHGDTTLAVPSISTVVGAANVTDSTRTSVPCATTSPVWRRPARRPAAPAPRRTTLPPQRSPARARSPEGRIGWTDQPVTRRFDRPATRSRRSPR